MLSSHLALDLPRDLMMIMMMMIIIIIIIIIIIVWIMSGTVPPSLVRTIR